MQDLTWNVEDQGMYGRDADGKVLVKGTWVIDEQGAYVVDHTFVDESLRGQGMAGKLMTKIADHFRAIGVQTSGSCSYAKAWYEKNKDAYKDILKG